MNPHKSHSEFNSPLDPFKPRPSKGDGFSSSGRSMEHVPEGESILIAAFKAASGMDTYEGAFAMHLRHIEKDLDRRTDPRGNLLPMAVILFCIGISCMIGMIAINV
jgi:hypothetical protein